LAEKIHVSHTISQENSVTILRVGSNENYANNWSKAFGEKTKKKTTTKAAAKPAAKKKSANKKTAKKK